MSNTCVSRCIKMWTVMILAVILAFGVSPTAATLPTWLMHYSCGQTIGGSDLGGFLVFNSDLLPSSEPNKCTVYIQPGTDMIGDKPYGILFHFSDFEMPGGWCRDANLTVIDGMDRSQDYISGLKNPMCRSNTSLTKDLVFASTEPLLVIEFKRARSYGSSYRAEFNMTFFPYHKDNCDDYEDVYECDNGRCIYNVSRCLNLNPCGDNSDCKEEEYSFWGDILNHLKQYLWIIVIIAGIYIVLKFIQSFRRKGGQLKDLPVIGCLFDSCKSNGNDTSQIQIRRSSLSRSRSTVRSASVVMEERSLSMSSDDESAPDRNARSSSFSHNINVDTGDQSAPPPTYNEAAPTGPPVITDMPPPPSYDEAMSNNDVYTKES